MYKQKLLLAFGSLFAMMLVSSGLKAQYDDMYYDPDDFRSTQTDRGYYDNEEPASFNEDDYRDRTSASNSDDEYYNYYYSSRIRRFNRPYSGFGYYDPVYVDMAYYDPFFRPAGTTVLIYNNPYGSAFRPGFGNRFAYGSPFGYSSFNRGWGSAYGAYGYNDPFYYGRGYNPGFGSPYGFGGGFGGFGSAYGGLGGYGGAGYYCPPAWGAGNVYSVPNSVNSRPVSSTPRAATTSIADRVERARRNATVGSRSNTVAPRGAATQSPATRTATRSAARTPNADTRSIDRTRTTVSPRSMETRRTAPAPAVRPSSRTYTPSRSTAPSRSTMPTRSATPSRSYTPSRSATPQRSVTPSRSATPSRSYTPSQSPAPTRSAAPTRTVTPSRRGGGK